MEPTLNLDAYSGLGDPGHGSNGKRIRPHSSLTAFSIWTKVHVWTKQDSGKAGQEAAELRCRTQVRWTRRPGSSLGAFLPLLQQELTGEMIGRNYVRRNPSSRMNGAKSMSRNVF